jgi:hypothetical protein
MFIDELCASRYHYDDMLNKDNWPVSAILKINRPFDKVLHSAVVAMEILLFREHVIGHPISPAIHPPTPALKRQLEATLSSMQEVTSRNKGILTERSTNIIQELNSSLSRIKLI